jgi:hypothetical protein
MYEALTDDSAEAVFGVFMVNVEATPLCLAEQRGLRQYNPLARLSYLTPSNKASVDVTNKMVGRR